MRTSCLKFASVVGIIIISVFLASVPRACLVKAQETSGLRRSVKGIVEVNTRFGDTLLITHAKGPSSRLRVELREWHLAGQNEPITFSAQGFYVAQVLWGDVTVQTGAVSQTREPGDFWTVEKGATMVISIKKPGEEALIQTFSVNPGN